MAIQMTQSHAVQEVAGERVSLAGMPADCPMMAQMDSKADKSTTPLKNHVGCQTCQLCMSLAVQNVSPSPLLAYERQAPPSSVGASFVSADLARQVKPPIL